MMRVLDLFSGIGGFSLGLERTGGFKTVAFCEIDPFCRAVLAKHWPDIPCHGDITTREFTKGEADVICGGFPCQDLSVAGKGAGLAGERSGLWRELLRAIRLVRPQFAIVENVAALLGRGLDVVLWDLAEIGYDAEWRCIPASKAGLPHRRDRLWIVAYPCGTGLPRFVKGESLLSTAETALTIARNDIAGAWRALDRDLDSLRGRDGVSVAMERRMKRAFPDGDGYVGVEMEPFDFWKSSLPRVLIIVSAGMCLFFAVLACVRA